MFYFQLFLAFWLSSVLLPGDLLPGVLLPGDLLPGVLHTMFQKKKYKRTNNDRQNIHIKLKIEQREPH
jgi:hypothetical protein